MPKIGIFDKMHPDNRPARNIDSENFDDTIPKEDVDPWLTKDDRISVEPVDPKKKDEEKGGIGAFWTIFLIFFFFGGAGLLLKVFGKQCLEKIESYRAG